MVDLKTKQITENDFLQYFDVDLASQLKDGDNTSRKFEIFAYRIQKRLDAIIFSVYRQNVDKLWNTSMTDFQKENYKLALLEQMMYVFKNGDVSLDSGYDAEKGAIASRDQMNEIKLCSNTINYLETAGLINRHIDSGIDLAYLWGDL